MNRILVVATIVATMGTACSGGAAETTRSTTQADPAVTSLAQAGAQSQPVPTTVDATTAPTTVTAQDGSFLPVYEIVRRVAGDSGDTVVVLLDPASYTSLSDIDLANVVNDVYDRFPPVYEAHIVDSSSAADLALEDAPSAADLAVLDQHYLVRLEEGFRIVFTGPFSQFPVLFIAS